jgi:two-component system, NtrC family, sensor kinase
MTFGRMTRLSWIYDLYRLGQAPGLLEDPARIYQQLLQHIVDGFEAHSGSLALLGDDASALTIVAGIELPPGGIGSSVAMGSGVLGWVAREGKPLLIDGALDAAKFPGIQRRREQAAPGSALCWPLKLQGRVIGALSVNRPEDRPPFSENDRDQGTALLNLASLALENIQLRLEQQGRILELQSTNRKLAEAQEQLLQAEKMASIGQLAAGVAHEINNPLGYVSANIGALERYFNELLTLVDACEPLDPGSDPASFPAFRELREKLDLPHLRGDVGDLLAESREGLERVRKIVLDLNIFAQVDRAGWQQADLLQGLESTLNILWNELKCKADLVKEYAEMPLVECVPSDINQVFMNLLLNAAQAVEDGGNIILRTGWEGERVWVEVEDTGKGITPENLKRVFDPFFTTRPVGMGTGLGLSLSYGIVKRHHGMIEVRSTPGAGTVFRVWLPVRQP